MRSVTVIILHTLIVQSLANDSMDKLADKLVDRAMTLYNHADLEKTTLAKGPAGTQVAPINLFQPVQARAASPLVPACQSVQCMQDTLKTYGISSSPLEKLALTALGATRDVSMAAQVKQAYASLDTQTQTKLQTARAEVTMKADDIKNDMAGITQPMGFFDPVGWTSQMSDAESLLFFREAELKHGRVAMIASLGMIVGEFYHPLMNGGEKYPGFDSLEALGKLQATNLQTFWAATFLACGGVELLASINQNQPFEKMSGYKIKEGWSLSEGPVPGDIGWDPLGFKPKDPKAWKDIQDKELNNGRLAMFAAAGMIAQMMVGDKFVASFGR